MKKFFIILLIILIFPVITLFGCKLDPQNAIGGLVAQSYTYNGIYYTRWINSFSFYSQYRESNVALSFTDTEFTLDICGNHYKGTWEKVKETSNKTYNEYKGSSTLFEMKDEKGNIGCGYSARWGFDGFSNYLGFTYLTYSADFVEPDLSEVVNENYTLEDEINRECEILAECINYNFPDRIFYEYNNCSYYSTGQGYYNKGEIIKKDNQFYFHKGESDTLLNLETGFFYDFDGSSIEFSNSIKQANCIYKYNSTCSYYAIFYV